ncbi:MAG: RNHCP domain-containing protein [Candidatus Pacebacteria bacterium]|nr:RNHCP domain-containing protein [Candidatus Paceibacterota bacterium]MDD5356790.1 RNHCP domain-containing protein [Candidatus Paceibacterota bacterium]
MKERKFQRKIEDFTCEHCGFTVSGTGYTNHCPKCLWSKHVDIHPGDRANTCGGMMRPVGSIYKGGEISVIQRCEKCNFEKKNKIVSEDNFDVLVSLAKNIS